jgi:hypothetical protein
MGGRKDVAFFEAVLHPHSDFRRMRPVGLPDVRIIVHNLVPVMAMLRLPVAGSDGKANLHLGGIGLGIDIATGLTTHAVQNGKQITEFPHGGAVAGNQIPYWDECLLISSRIQKLTDIGYLGVDLTIDEDQGPMLLEVNVRPGAAIQIANLAPLRSRLERVKGISVKTPEKGVRIAKDLFGITVQASTKKEDKPVLGVCETISLKNEETKLEIPAHLSPLHDESFITSDLATNLHEEGMIIAMKNDDNERYHIKFSLHNKKVQTTLSLMKEPITEADSTVVSLLLGRKALQGFLIDPSKQHKHQTPQTSITQNLKTLDRRFAKLDASLNILTHIKPINLDEEIARAQEDERYNPILHYSPCEENLHVIQVELETPIVDTSPLGQLLERKRQELLLKTKLIEYRGQAEQYTSTSKQLFGTVSSNLARAAAATVHNRDFIESSTKKKDYITAPEAAERFAKVIQEYGMQDWKVIVSKNIVARCTVASKQLLVRHDAVFTETAVRALIAHEIETHILCQENSRHQPYHILKKGTAGYLATQEGLASYNQNRVYTPDQHVYFSGAFNTLGLQFALDHSFADTRAYLMDELQYPPNTALRKALMYKRGLHDTSQPGAFTKGVVYYKGLRMIEEFVEQGGELARLYIGRIALEDLETIEQLPSLEPPLILPEWLRR